MFSKIAISCALAIAAFVAYTYYLDVGKRPSEARLPQYKSETECTGFKKPSILQIIVAIFKDIV